MLYIVMNRLPSAQERTDREVFGILCDPAYRNPDDLLKKLRMSADELTTFLEDPVTFSEFLDYAKTSIVTVALPHVLYKLVDKAEVTGNPQHIKLILQLMTLLKEDSQVNVYQQQVSRMSEQELRQMSGQIGNQLIGYAKGGDADDSDDEA